MDVVEGVNSKFAALDILEEVVTDPELIDPGDHFTCLPPEMIKGILEHLVADPRDLMRCRLVCHILKDQVDSMLESNILSVWNWDPHFHGKDKPPYRSRLRQPLPSGPVFQTTQKLNRFILDIEKLPVTSNPFPNRSIFFRRVRKSNSVPNHLYNQANRYLDFSACMDHWGAQDDPNLLSLSSTYHLLKKFGGHLTSLIFESGPTVTLPSIVAFHSILHNLPNVRCLMFRTTWIDITNPIPGLNQENILLPSLPHLESLKILYCDRFITESLLRNYGGLSLPSTNENGSPKSGRSKVTKVQVIARDICWINYLKNVVHNENGISGENAFPQLEEFKLGNISTVPSFSLLEKIFQQKLWPFLTKLSLQFCGDSPGFKIPARRLLSSVLNNFPKLREFYFDVLECSQGSILLDPVTSDQSPEEFVESEFPKKGTFGILRLTCPAFLLDSPWFVALVTRKMRSLRILQFRLIDQWLMACGDSKRAADPVNYDLQIKINYSINYDLLEGTEELSGRTLLLMAQSKPELVDFRVVMETFWKQLPALRQINVFPADDNRDFEAFQTIDAVHECIMSAHKLNKLKMMNIKV